MNFKIIQSLGLVILVGLSLNTIAQKKIIGINSPSNNLSLSIIKPADGSIVYTLDMGAIPVLHESKLGIKIKDEADYLTNIIVDSSRVFTNNTTWKPVWGEVSEIRDNYTAVILYTHSKISTRRINIEFRLFDDGLGFRYLFPISTVPGKNHMVILDEFTTFQLTDNHLAYWVPMDFDSQEYPPSTTRLSEVKAKKIIEEVKSI